MKTIYLALMLLVSSAFSFANARGGNNSADPNARICFYRDINFTGDSFCVRAGRSDANLIDTGWNDSISSVSIEGQASLRMFTNIGFTGNTLTVNGSVANFGIWGIFMNDQISSYQSVGSGSGNGGGDDGGQGDAEVCFYDQPGFRGDSFCLYDGEQVRNLARTGWDDRIASVWMDGQTTVTLYEERAFGGRTKRLNGSARDLRNWAYRASSVRVGR